MGDAPELPLRCVEARLFCAWVRNSPMPAFANNANALYAAAWWARYTARDEAIAQAVALAKARGASESTMKRADHVAWRIADPAGFEEFGPPMRKRQKAEEKAKLEALRAAESVLVTVYKKIRRVARAAALEKDAQKAAQKAARARALADVADAKLDELARRGIVRDPLSRLVDLMRAVRTEEAIAIRAARAAAGHEAAAAAAARATAAGAAAAEAAAAARAAYNAAVYGIDE
jgi:dTMP kinase